MKSEVMVEVSEGDGQIARAREDGCLKAKTWNPGGVAADQALPLVLRHLLIKKSLSAVIVNFEQRLPNEFLNSRSSLCHRFAALIQMTSIVR